jgi:hypothetical protein
MVDDAVDAASTVKARMFRQRDGVGKRARRPCGNHRLADVVVIVGEGEGLGGELVGGGPGAGLSGPLISAIDRRKLVVQGRSRSHA